MGDEIYLEKIVSYPSRYKADDITGLRFNKVLVIGYLGHFSHRSLYICKCDCGQYLRADGYRVKRGLIKSCGCIRSDVKTTHGESSHYFKSDGGPRKRVKQATKEYRAWTGMLGRCHNPKNDNYPRYGGRGIRVCGEWQYDFSVFLADVGRAPTGSHSIERIRVNGNYEPGNVCWATPRIQANNRHNSQRLGDNQSSGLLGFGA